MEPIHTRAPPPPPPFTKEDRGGGTVIHTKKHLYSDNINQQLNGLLCDGGGCESG